MVYYPAAQDPQDSETATATEADACIAEGRDVVELQNHHRRRLIAGAVASSAVLAAAATVAIVGAGDAASWLTGGVIGREEVVTLKPRVGCTNWRDIQIGSPLKGLSAEKCKETCENTKDCMFANYQPGECDADDQLEKGACYLFGAGCKERKNVCWDLHTAMGPPSYMLKAPRTGCKNWASIKIGDDAYTSKNVLDCAALCAQKESEGCALFNYQPAECGSDESHSAGACCLFKANCEETKNSCWDLYSHINASDLKSYALITKNVDKGSTLLPVVAKKATSRRLSQGGVFESSDILTVVSTSSTNKENVTVKDSTAAEITLEAGTVNAYGMGDVVVKMDSVNTPAAGEETEIETEVELKSDQDQATVETMARKAMAEQQGVSENDVSASAAPKGSRRVLMEVESDADAVATTTMEDRRLATTDASTTEAPKQGMVIWIIIIKIRVVDPVKANAVKNKCSEINKAPNVFATVVVRVVQIMGLPDTAFDKLSLVVSAPKVIFVKIVVNWNKFVDVPNKKSGGGGGNTQAGSGPASCSLGSRRRSALA